MGSMKESKFLNRLLPTSPDFLPIVREIRKKYQLPEISSDDEPIEEIFLNGKPVSLKDFHQEIKTRVEEGVDYLPTDASKILLQIKAFVRKPLNTPWLKLIPKKDKKTIEDFYDAMQKWGEQIVNILDQFNSSIADMLYAYMLTGEVEELTSDWISKVVSASVFGEPVVIAMARSS